MANKASGPSFETVMLVGGVTIVAGIWLTSKPNCPTCSTVAEHLIEHGIKEIFTGII